MEEDKDLNQTVMELVKKCQERKVVGIERIIEGYQIHFRFTKIGSGNNKVEGATQTEKIGGALSGMGDEITKTFAGI